MGAFTVEDLSIDGRSSPPGAWRLERLERHGEWTDDTQMAVCIAEVTAAGSVDLDAIGQGFLAWYASGPKDVGVQTSRVLAAARGASSRPAEAAAALGVMSQGELHALALSLFLPRATLPESPFRFLVIDDPVQSMDPARVDGLARVLAEVAAERQVVVFTHDTRLPDAVRRLGRRAGGPARAARPRPRARHRAARGDDRPPATTTPTTSPPPPSSLRCFSVNGPTEAGPVQPTRSAWAVRFVVTTG